jgi:hypothetical protein
MITRAQTEMEGQLTRRARKPATVRAVVYNGVVDAQDRIAELEAENTQLRALNAALTERVRVLEEQLAMVMGKVAELERLLGQNSSDSSWPAVAGSGPGEIGSGGDREPHGARSSMSLTRRWS